MVSQRSIYDARYAASGYDTRSKIRVLTAEAEALDAAVARATRSRTGAGTLSIFDFGYGTGRVTNEFLLQFPAWVSRRRGMNLHVIAYDVSAVGLRKAACWLSEEHTFAGIAGLTWRDSFTTGYIAGSITREWPDTAVTVTFVHGCEDDPSTAVAGLVRAANGGAPVDVSTSWYSGLGHVEGAATRAAFFTMLDDVGDQRGEIIVATSVSGDLVDAQREWADKLATHDVDGHPIEVYGDVMYETELGQNNYYHVFGTDLAELLQSIRHANQEAWIEAIRFPAEEFATAEEEQQNYDLVRAFNDKKRHDPWTPADYAQVHTAAAIRTGGKI